MCFSADWKREEVPEHKVSLEIRFFHVERGYIYVLDCLVMTDDSQTIGRTSLLTA